jgi:hypothetical protein
MTPRMRTHAITGALFLALVAVAGLVWALRGVLVYVLLVALGVLVYYGLFLFVSARLRSRAEPRPDDEGRDRPA